MGMWRKMMSPGARLCEQKARFPMSFIYETRKSVPLLLPASRVLQIFSISFQLADLNPRF